ncbi:Alg9-like mannosyltransferase family-domain-containing protein [Gamsiella multidivaricata]|uniref:Alg9-like mannosyltransferase family-domain-containing protein n=1 Tax=Gamsiella multidivaricata TaxID=101098 RepID=UPI0022204668|nr:Alg9-like mannosyltransferase family-domain-containing protein [Gamsiella multidivaricata]KAI7825165.1 Alg9-like mannosyltransferase family-domain-containing protein [Gamsiella multidivaricata]
MVPSSTPGINSRSRNDGPVADRVVPATTETSMTGTAASTTATATTATTTLKQRKISATNGHGSSNGQANGKLNGILMDRRKIVDDNNDDSQDSNSDTNSEVLDPLTGEPLRLRDYASPYCPSFSVAFKALFLVRALAATYSNISDCDEVFNFWEPMHYLQYGTGLETWEYSPVYAIRSWAYILAHALPAEITRLAMSANRLQVFFILRIILGAVSAHCEATLYRTVVDEVDPRIGRYLLLVLISSAGTWIASNAFLPSTFAMYTTMMFFSQMLQPPRHHSGKRTFWAIFWVGLGALLGWPFSAAVGLPFALEELLVHSRNHSRKKTVRFRDWRMVRLLQLTTSTIVVLGCVLVPIMIIDQYYYKKLVIVPLNIVLYNVFGGDVGPDIFGTEPWWFYILNGLLNFNVLFPAALFSLPMLLITYFAIPDVLPAPPSSGGLSLKDPLLWFSLKLSPFYLWFAIFTAQPHKEERFLFVVYPLICFNAVMTLFMAQKIIQRTLDRFVTRSKTAAIHKYAAGLVWLVLLASAAVSLSRILALYEHYSAPIDVYRKAFDMVKVPGPMVVEGSDSTVTGGAAALANNRDPAKIVRVCVGKEWYRFPSHYFLPEGAKLGFLKSHFDGLLPGEFQELPLNAELPIVEARPSAARGKEHRPLRIDWRWSAERRPGTSFVPKQMNNQNMEVFEHYTPLDQCDYLVDLDYGGRAGEDESQGQDSVEPRYLQDKEHWERLYCRRFLDTKVGAGRNRWVRAFWIPDQVTVALTRGQTKVWGDYCLARRKSL